MPLNDHEAIFRRVCRDLERMPAHQRNGVAEQADVAPITLYFWIAGRTRAPLMRTLFPVAKALGYEITMKQRRRLRSVA